MMKKVEANIATEMVQKEMATMLTLLSTFPLRFVVHEPMTAIIVVAQGGPPSSQNTSSRRHRRSHEGSDTHI